MYMFFGAIPPAPIQGDFSMLRASAASGSPGLTQGAQQVVLESCVPMSCRHVSCMQVYVLNLNTDLRTVAEEGMWWQTQFTQRTSAGWSWLAMSQGRLKGVRGPGVVTPGVLNRSVGSQQKPLFCKGSTYVFPVCYGYKDE